MSKKIKGSYLLNAVGVALVFALLTGLFAANAFGTSTTYIQGICTTACYTIIMVTSLNLVVGFMGEFSLGHAGFVSVGAYVSAIVSGALAGKGLSDLGLFLIALLVGGLAAGIMGVLVGIPALRLKGDYLAIITLGFGLIIVNVINNLPFAGQNGLAEGVASSSLYQNGLGFGTTAKVTYLWVALAAVIICVVLMFMFIRSKYGRAIRAIRNDEIAASAAGINTSYYKVLTFSFSAFFAGVAGALYACANASLSTSSFSFTNGGILNSTFVVVMVVLGGMGSLTGSIFSAVIMYVLNYQIKNGAWVSALPGFLQGVFTYPMLVYALVLVVIIIFRPKGIFGSYEFSLTGLASSLAAKLRGSKKSAAKEAAQHE